VQVKEEGGLMNKPKTVTKRLTLELETVRRLVVELAQPDLRYVRGGGVHDNTSTTSTQLYRNNRIC
jgi:hypothetical protein